MDRRTCIVRYAVFTDASILIRVCLSPTGVKTGRWLHGGVHSQQSPQAKLTEENGHLEAELETKMEWTEWHGGEAQKAQIHKMGLWWFLQKYPTALAMCFYANVNK